MNVRKSRSLSLRQRLRQVLAERGNRPSSERVLARGSWLSPEPRVLASVTAIRPPLTQR